MSSSCWLAKQFEDLGIPVIFVRTKVDEAVDQVCVEKRIFSIKSVLTNLAK